MTLFSLFVALTTALIGFSVGRAYVYREIRANFNLVKQFAISDTPIGDALAAELNIMLAKIDAGERA